MIYVRRRHSKSYTCHTLSTRLNRCQKGEDMVSYKRDVLVSKRDVFVSVVGREE